MEVTDSFKQEMLSTIKSNQLSKSKTHFKMHDDISADDT